MKRLINSIIIIIFVSGISCSSKYSSDKKLDQKNLTTTSKETDNYSETIQELQGTWIHDQDSLATVEIVEDQWIDKYEGQEIIDSLNIEFTDKLPMYVNTTVKTTFLILTQQNDTSYYEILGISDSIMSLIQYPTGHRHLYRKKK